MAKKAGLFEDLAAAMEPWIAATSKALTDREADLAWVETDEPYRDIRNALADASVSEKTVAKVLSECFLGFAVSFLTTLDGGTSLAEKGRLYVVDEGGNRLDEGLHEDFVGYFIDTGRLI
jgi:hypothetical protein